MPCPILHGSLHDSVSDQAPKDTIPLVIYVRVHRCTNWYFCAKWRIGQVADLIAITNSYMYMLLKPKPNINTALNLADYVCMNLCSRKREMHYLNLINTGLPSEYWQRIYRVWCFIEPDWNTSNKSLSKLHHMNIMENSDMTRSQAVWVSINHPLMSK